MKKIILSVAMIAAVAAVAIGATTAYFSDTETSTGNTFTAGEIDLTVDNTSYRSDEQGNLVYSSGTSWTLTDLDKELFFNFADLKPGDLGEDTISLHVNSNDAWLCADIDITENNDVTCTEPELDDDQSCAEDNGNPFDGDLAQALNFVFWADDGDNVLEADETVLTSGPASDVLDGVTYALADAGNNIWTGSPGPMGAGQTQHIGKAWCFGSITTSPLVQGEGGPDQRPESVTCNGSQTNNAAQSDNLMGDITFYAEQARNNPEFLCANRRPT